MSETTVRRMEWSKIWPLRLWRYRDAGALHILYKTEPLWQVGNTSILEWTGIKTWGCGKYVELCMWQEPAYSFFLDWTGLPMHFITKTPIWAFQRTLQIRWLDTSVSLKLGYQAMALVANSATDPVVNSLSFICFRPKLAIEQRSIAVAAMSISRHISNRGYGRKAKFFWNDIWCLVDCSSFRLMKHHGWETFSTMPSLVVIGHKEHRGWRE